MTAYAAMKPTEKTRIKSHDVIVFTHRRWRHFLAFVTSTLVSIIVVSAMPTYLPLAPIDAIGLPIFFFPLIWSFFSIHAYFAEKIQSVLMVQGLFAVSHAIFIYFALV